MFYNQLAPLNFRVWQKYFPFRLIRCLESEVWVWKLANCIKCELNAGHWNSHLRKKKKFDWHLLAGGTLDIGQYSEVIPHTSKACQNLEKQRER